LYDAFFKYQTKPTNLTKFGDVYYEGKELEVNVKVKPGAPLSEALREAMGMTLPTSPPPWLLNMQRYGPPPSYPSLRIPGLTAPLPSPDCQYGYHPGGWGKPPVNQFGQPLYGGNPFDPPGSGIKKEMDGLSLVTSDGKTVSKADWGALPVGELAAEESEEEISSEEEMEESDEEGQEEEEGNEVEGIESVLPPLPSALTGTGDIRKQAGDETPLFAPKQLYQVIDRKLVSADLSTGTVFASEVAYVLPGSQPTATAVPEGAESVLAKAVSAGGAKRNRKEDEDEDDLAKNFKF
jgi:splicing factor 3B subunit 2